MTMIFGKPAPLLFGQLLLGIINGSFYAMLSMGLAIIFGLLKIINFAHGAMFMVGAFVTWMLLNYLGIDFWIALVLAPVIVGALGLLLERTLIQRIYKLDILYGLLLTFGIALALQGAFTNYFGSSGVSYNAPAALSGVLNLGFMYLPVYRGFVVLAAIVICAVTWFLIERTKLGALLRAATENPTLVQSFGVNVPRLIALTFAAGVGLAALAGVLAAPLYSVNPDMGADLINTVFAVVVIGGMGSIGGAILTGFGLGIIEGFTDVFYPPGSAVVIFVVMAIVLLARPAGLFGKAA
ncbi:MAG: branched-chain amino acid ABC transporter permease [Rhodospirillales bacterium 20-64-7]|nr:MAG: branched-chain amino acid ABC transporter permease [Rhodospirillales bacterium 20-64-7]